MEDVRAISERLRQLDKGMELLRIVVCIGGSLIPPDFVQNEVSRRGHVLVQTLKETSILGSNGLDGLLQRLA